jgi:pyridinium-3,5-bisthiocarboxylic acid mononucleotide nickel chelatase
MKQSIYIECYEGLSARMLTEALLDLMPEGKAARKLVAGLRKLSCSEAARQEMLHNMQERIHEFALPADAERLFARAYGIWLNAKATVEHVEPEELRFSKRDFDGVIAMMTTAIGMEQLQIGEVICPVLYEGFECITTQDGKKQVPLPETLYILMDTGIALQRMERDGAWVTPEAAALLAACKIVRHLPKQYQMISQGVGNGVSSEGEPARLRVVLLRRNSVARQMRPEVLTPKRAELELLTPDSAEPKFIPLKSVEKEEQRSEPGSDQNVPGKAVKSGQPDHETGQVKTVSEEFAVYSEGAVCTDADKYRRMDVSAWTSADEICKLECNLDDCSGEVLGYTMERLMREGARDVSYMPIYMKKNRPAYLLTVLCHPDDRERMEQIIFAETTAIGIRHAIMQRSILHRETDQKKSSFGKVAVKRLQKEQGKVLTLEYDSVAAIARSTGLPFRDVYRSIELELSGKNEKGEETT